MLPRTLLITGANSGLGYETARLLLERDETTCVIVSTRSARKAEATRNRLLDQTRAQPDRVGDVVMDLAEPETVREAVRTLGRTRLQLDGVVLNAGGQTPVIGDRLPLARSGLTQLFAMNIAGHAQLVYGILDHNLLRTGGTLVFAATEASRGIAMLGTEAPCLPGLDAPLNEVLLAVARGDHLGSEVDATQEYGLVKLIGTVWMRQLALDFGHRLRAVAVSPGMTTGTGATERVGSPVQRWFMRNLMLPMFHRLGRAHTLEEGARRYLQGLDDPSLANGAFYASPSGGVAGPLTQQSPVDQPLLNDDAFAEAVGEFLRQLAGSPEATAARAISNA